MVTIVAIWVLQSLAFQTSPHALRQDVVQQRSSGTSVVATNILGKSGPDIVKMLGKPVKAMRSSAATIDCKQVPFDVRKPFLDRFTTLTYKLPPFLEFRVMLNRTVNIDEKTKKPAWNRCVDSLYVELPKGTSLETFFMRLGLESSEWTKENAKERPGCMTFDWNRNIVTRLGASGVILRYYDGSQKNFPRASVAIDFCTAN